jgi:proline iminopeptidase
VPSNYLLPLVRIVPYRSILFYDQLGCGTSDEPKADDGIYSVGNAVGDLEVLLKHLGVRRFHLYGQSFGGILAYEFLKRQASKEVDDGIAGEGCRSVILSSTPTNVMQIEDEARSLVEKLDSPDLFRETHQRRISPMPQALTDAYAYAGTAWRGTGAIADYKATPPSANSRKLPSALVLRGEHDFVTEVCVADWKRSLWNTPYVRERVLDGCSHHGLLENGPLYGEIVDSFFTEYD